MSTIRQFSRILVAIDQSENSAKAFDYAIQLARMSGGKVFAVFAIEIPTATYGVTITFSELEKYLEEEGNKFLHELAQKVEQEYGVKLEPIVQKGHASEVILDSAESIKADIIVMGSRGMTSIKELFLGSVSHAIVNQANVPVLIVK
jgi:nucleotide-binding universal stress UspA family protein